MIRKLAFLLFLIFSSAYSLTAQWLILGDPQSKFFISADARSGLVSQKTTFDSLTSGYLNAINRKEGKITIDNNTSTSFNFRVGYYFNAKKTIGISTGLQYTTQKYSMALDSFHVEYQSLDFQDTIFRQVLTSNQGINESVKTVNISIPVLLMLRFRLGDAFYLTIDGGILLNSQYQSTYTANSQFDYEAIYKYAGGGVNRTAVYDNNVIPSPTDWIITAKQVISKNPTIDVDSFFNALSALGYNVGLGKNVNKSGSVGFTSSSMGYIFEPALEHQVKNRLFIRLGFYYTSQSFSLTPSDLPTPLTDKVGTYNSLLNKVRTIQTTSYGLTLGLKMFVGK